jgi:hypothetical protein
MIDGNVTIVTDGATGFTATGGASNKTHSGPLD